jgi:ABC-type branched-subunit amino acid transport system substrate-binding protein
VRQYSIGHFKTKATLLVGLSVLVVGASCSSGGGGDKAAQSVKAASPQAVAEEQQASQPQAAPSDAGQAAASAQAPAASQSSATPSGSNMPDYKSGGTTASPKVAQGQSTTPKPGQAAAPSNQPGTNQPGTPAAKATPGQPSNAPAAPTPGQPGAAPSNLGSSDVGVTPTEIKLGSISGVNTPLGNIIASPVTATVNAMFKSINDAGGVLGRKMTITDCDDAGDVGRFRACFRKLVEEDKIFSFFTSVTWGSGEVHGDLAGAKIPWVGSWGFYTSEWKDPWMFPIHMASQHEAHGAAIYARDVLKPKTVGILYLNSPEQLQAKKNIHQVLDPAGIKVVRELAQEIDTADESSNVLSMRAANPDHILAFSWPPPVTKFIVDATQQGYWPPKGLDSNHYAIEAIQELIGDFPTKGLYTITNFKVWSDNAEYLAIIRKYAPQLMKKHHHKTQGAYVAARTFAEAARQIGPDLTRAKLIQTLESQPWDAGPGLGVQFFWKAGNHDTARCEYMWKYTGQPTGSQRVWEPAPEGYNICDNID